MTRATAGLKPARFRDGLAASARGILAPVLDRPRMITLSWAAAFLALFGARRGR